MTPALLDYYKLAEEGVRLVQNTPADLDAETLDVRLNLPMQDSSVPSETSELVDYLRMERYRSAGDDWKTRTVGVLKAAYYSSRPLMPDFARTRLQRMYFSKWREIPFPNWPVDFSVERILQAALTAELRRRGSARIPFIWFWPNGLPSCAIMTHDVETVAGRDFCSRLMDMDDSFRIKAAFQIVPERRYPVSEPFLDSMRNRGFEINVHDLNHDGLLFRDRQTFSHRARKINEHARRFGSLGFRAGALYRNADWLAALDVDYDMSIPNAAHMEPQRGGCCTVMPFFIGNILELPLTMTQDWALITVLQQHSCELWKREIGMVAAEHGLVSFIVHPDYLLTPKAQAVYRELLAHLAALRSAGKLWIALPSEVNLWWRQRSQMRLVRRGQRWVIDGPGRERARVAYARLSGGRLTYDLEPDRDSEALPTVARV